MKDKDQARQNFLMKMYGKSWTNIMRTDESMWKLFMSYATVVIGAISLSDKVLKNPFLGLIVTLFITAVMTCYSFNVNLWFLRNLIIIGNLEASFLYSTDYNKIIPKRWKPPYEGKFFSFKEFPTILGFSYTIFEILIIYIYIEELNRKQIIMLGIIFIVLSILTICYTCNLVKRFEDIKKDAPGP